MKSKQHSESEERKNYLPMIQIERETVKVISEQRLERIFERGSDEG